MLRAVRALALSTIVAVTGALAYGTLAPRRWHVEAQTLVAAPISAIAPLVSDPSRWSEWSVWTRARDPLARLSTSGAGEGEGARRQWLGPRLGTGELTVLSADPGSGVSARVALEHGAASSELRIAWRATARGTELHWVDEGELPAPLGGWFLRRYEAALAQDLEASLDGLRRAAEAPPPRAP